MIDFLKGVFSSGTAESAKRVFGAIGFLCGIIFIALWKHEFIPDLIYSSMALLGLGTFETLINRKNGNNNSSEKSSS